MLFFCLSHKCLGHVADKYWWGSPNRFTWLWSSFAVACQKFPTHEKDQFNKIQAIFRPTKKWKLFDYGYVGEIEKMENWYRINA